MKFLIPSNRLAPRLGFVICVLLAGAALRTRAEDHTTNILDAVTNNLAGPFTLGDTGPFNFLLLTNGALLADTTGTIGNTAGAHDNLAIVTGTNSVWRNTTNFLLGVTGSVNRLHVRDGAKFYSGRFILGSEASASNNSVIASGSGTAWTNSADFTVGLGGANNSALVTAGVLLQTGNITIGEHSASNRMTLAGGACLRGKSVFLGIATNASGNVLALDGPGTGTNIYGNFVIGVNSPGNSLLISNGAYLDNWLSFQNTTILGSNVTSCGNLISVSGTGSFFGTYNNIFVGKAGSGNCVIVSGGAGVSCINPSIGEDCTASSNLVLVTGPGTIWYHGNPQVGGCGTANSFIVSNGASAFADGITSGLRGGGGNSILVTGSQSYFQCDFSIISGYSGVSNSLAILDGARMVGSRDSIGYYGDESTAFVSGAGSSWSNASLTVGRISGHVPFNASHNRLTLANGARLDTGNLWLGQTSGTTENSARIQGVGTVLNVTTNLVIGYWGASNQLSISAGAVAFIADAYLGASAFLSPTLATPSDANLLALDGVNSVLNITSNLWVGCIGSSNRVEIRDGAQVNDLNGVLGVTSGATGSVALVTGPGAVWNHTNSLIVGSNGLGHTLTISRGGVVRDETGIIGAAGPLLTGGGNCQIYQSFDRVTVTDPGSLWENRGRLYVGRAAEPNYLNILNAGVVTAGGALIGESSGIPPSSSCGPFPGQNELAVLGGCLAVTNATRSAVLEARFGTLTIFSGEVFADSLVQSNGGIARIYLGGGTLRVRDTLVTNGPPFAVGDGLHSARFQIEPLANFNDTGNLLVSPGLVVQPHGSLTGSGRLLGPATNHGVIAPGYPLAGRLFVRAPLTLMPGSALHFDVAGNTGGFNYDYLDATVPLVFNGSLRVTLRNGFVPGAAQVFRVITGPSLSGAFANVAFGARLKTTDNLGSFLVVTNGGAVELRDYQSADLDGDGLEDAWALAHFGHSPLTPAERAADADGDGASNEDEFRADTDPGDASSALKVTITNGKGGVSLSFPFVEGKTYHLRASDDLVQWRTVEDPTFLYATPGLCEWSDDGKSTGGLGARARFYRVTVE